MIEMLLHKKIDAYVSAQCDPDYKVTYEMFEIDDEIEVYYVHIFRVRKRIIFNLYFTVKNFKAYTLTEDCDDEVLFMEREAMELYNLIVNPYKV